MKIDNEKIYKVESCTPDGKITDYGTMNGKYLKEILKGTTYDELLECYYTKNCSKGYFITEM